MQFLEFTRSFTEFEKTVFYNLMEMETRREEPTKFIKTEPSRTIF